MEEADAIVRLKNKQKLKEYQRDYCGVKKSQSNNP